MKLIKLQPDITYPILFTRGRIHRQKTVRYLPKEIQKDLIVVTCESESVELAKALEEKYQVSWKHMVKFPDEYRLVRKRYLVVKWLKKCGGTKFIFMDDDLTISALGKDLKYKSARSELGNKLFMRSWNRLDSLWSKFSGIGMSASSRNNRNFLTEDRLEGGNFVQKNTKSGGFFGYKVDPFLSSFRFAEQYDLLQSVAYVDLLSNIVTLNEVGDICRNYNIAWATTFDVKKESGGMNVYRNRTNNGIAFLLMQLLLPGSFSRKPGTEERFDDIIRINRQAWKPIREWGSQHFHFDDWYKAIRSEILTLEPKGIKTLFPEEKPRSFVAKLLKKMKEASSNGTNILDIQEGSATLKLNGEISTGAYRQVIPIALQHILEGGTLRVYIKVVDKSLRKFAEALALQCNRVMVLRWRVVDGSTPESDLGLKEAYRVFLSLQKKAPKRLPSLF